MRRRSALGIIWILFLGQAILAADEVLPPSGFEDWKLRGKARTYSGDALYNHIDGGAEPFLELGFESCEVRLYVKDKQELTAECYRMNDAAAALGIYLMQCGKETPDPAFPEHHTASANQLTFVKGRHLFRLTGRPGVCPKRDMFLRFARYAAGRIPTAPPPAVLQLLPEEGKVRGTVRIVRGQVTLSALAPPFSPEALALAPETPAIAADYLGEAGEPFTLLVVEQRDPALAAQALARLRRGLEPGAPAQAAADSKITFRDTAGHPGRAWILGKMLHIAWGAGLPLDK